MSETAVRPGITAEDVLKRIGYEDIKDIIQGE